MALRGTTRRALVTAALFFALCWPAVSETTNRSPYGAHRNVDFEEIEGFEVRAFPLRMAHPWEIVIPNTELGQVMACQISDGPPADPNSLPSKPGLGDLFADTPESMVLNSRTTNRDLQFFDSGPGETRVYFAHKISDATFRCFKVWVTRGTG